MSPRNLRFVALVEVEARLVALGHVQGELPPCSRMVTSVAPWRRAASPDRVQAFEAAHAGIGALIELARFQARGFEQRVGDDPFPQRSQPAERNWR